MIRMIHTAGLNLHQELFESRPGMVRGYPDTERLPDDVHLPCHDEEEETPHECGDGDASPDHPGGPLRTGYDGRPVFLRPVAHRSPLSGLTQVPRVAFGPNSTIGTATTVVMNEISQ